MNFLHASQSATTATMAGFLLMVAGCGQRQLSLDELVDQAATLPGVRSSQHSRLREEFRLVEQSQTLPEMLNQQSSLTHKNAAHALADVLNDLEQSTKINEQLSALLGVLPAASAEFIASESDALSAKWLHQTAGVAEASKLPECNFGLKFERGYFNDLDFVYHAAAACRLLLVDALYKLETNSDLSLDRFQAAWQWTDRLSNTGHLEARVQASMLRREALHVAEVIANRPQVTIDDWRGLYQPLRQSLEQWPSLEATLIRERALALVTYETLRLGLADLVFTTEERSQLRSEGVYDSLRRATDEQIDADEAAYLTYMREVLSVANQPFYVRTKHLVECDRLLRANEQTDDYPWFANHLFVLSNSLTLAQAELARDRARLEGWLHLLAKATTLPPPENQVSPLNGEEYVAHQQGNAWYVDLEDRRTTNPRLTVAAN